MGHGKYLDGLAGIPGLRVKEVPCLFAGQTQELVVFRVTLEGSILRTTILI